RATCPQPLFTLRRHGHQDEAMAPSTISTLRLPRATTHLAQATSSASHRTSKSAGGDDVVEIAEVVADPREVEHFAEPSQGNAKTIGATETAKLAPSLNVRFHVAEHARYAAFLQFLLKLGN